MNPTARALLAHAADPVTPDTVLFARLVAARIESGDLALLGLDRRVLAALVARHFPHDLNALHAPIAPLVTRHASFVHDLHELLMLHDCTAMREPEDAHCLATIISAASLRPDHLWRDLGLSGRDDVTDMLERHYPMLVARNTTNLRWKKFLAQEVAHAQGVAPTSAPGCPGCDDYGLCYPGNR